MEIFEKTVEKNYVYKGRIINVRCDKAELHNGNPCTREVVEHNGGVCIAPITENNELIFVRQFRYPYMEMVLELPAGKLELGEDPFEAGKRELEEETGTVAENYYNLGKFYPTPGYCTEKIYIFIATELTHGDTDFDQGEFVELVKMPLTQAIEMVMSGQIRDAKTQIALLKLKEELRK